MTKCAWCEYEFNAGETYAIIRQELPSGTVETTVCNKHRIDWMEEQLCIVKVYHKEAE